MYQGEDQNFTTPPPAIISHENHLVNGVLVPGLQSGITGLLTGLCFGAVSSALKLSISPWEVGLVAGSGAALYGWLAYRHHWQWTLERVLGIDLDRDGYIGEPVPPESIRVELIRDDGRQGDFIDLPYPEKLPRLAAGILQGRQFSLSAWTGQAGLFSRAEFEAIRAELLRRNLARWKNEDSPSQGVELTAAGRSVFRKLAEQHSPTFPSWQ